MQDLSNIISPTRIHHPTKESYVVSAEEAKELFKQGWYPRRKMAVEAREKKPEISSANVSIPESVKAPEIKEPKRRGRKPKR